MKNNIKLIAYYLPQFHPIPENDKWWGKGFTEWTNVKKAKPLFEGHEQPVIPGELGYYNLLDPEVREKQANLAKEYSIYGFCYWHYWFAGKRLLERPFNEVLESGKPDFPFCLAWANDTWKGKHYGAAPDKVLIKQTYPGLSDYREHFDYVLNAFLDKRYIQIDGKPVFIVYKPRELPDPKEFTDYWRKLAKDSGLEGLYLIGTNVGRDWNPAKHGFDAYTPNPAAFQYDISNRTNKLIRKLPESYLYEDIIKYALRRKFNFNWYPGVIPNWDNTPRAGVNGFIYSGSNPELFKKHLKEAVDLVKNREEDKRIIFVKSWNEWAEGNYLEPDKKWGRKCLEAVREVMGK